VSLTREFLIGLGVLPTAETWIEGFAAELHHATTGTPLLVLETLKLALDRGTLLFAHGRWTCPDPAALHAMLERGEALRSRVTALRREEHRLLALLVLIGMPLDADRIGNAAGIDPKAIQGTLESLERRGLVIRALGRYEVAHDEVGAAALAALTPAETASGHLSIGRVLEIGAGNDPILLARAARHFRLGGDAHGVATQFRHAVAAIRKRGDRRSLSVLAAEFLGPDAGPAESRRLVATLPLHVRAGLWSRRRSATAAGVLGVMLFLAAAWLRTAPPPAEARLIVLRRLDSVTVVRGSLEVRSTAWRERQRLTVSGEDQPLSDPVLARSTLRPTVSPDGIRWLFRAGSDNAEGEDIYLRSAQGTRVVAAATGNDSHPRWLQGGMRAAFLTRRWSHDGDDYDIGIVDLSTGEVRDLTPTRDWEEGFAVSPDGVRIAFPRRLRAPGDPLVCRILVDGSEERCTALPGYSGLEVVGWLGNRDLLVTADDESRRVLLRVNPESGERTVAFDGTVSDVVVSPDGRWVACRCEWSGEPPDWYVFPARDPDAARPLSWPGGAVEGVAWQVDQWDRGGMDSLVISAGVVPIRLGGSYRLSAQAFDTRGGRVGLREGEVHWTSSDSTMASIHPVTGELVAHRMGLVRIGASVAGGRSASIMLPVLLPASEASRLLLNEVWDGPGLSQWKSYGEPVPVLATGPDGIRGMTNNGDGSYPSGVHSALTYPAVAGLGIEVLLDAPVKQPQWQAQSLGFTSARRTPFETWDHRWLGPPLIRAYEREACDLGYPSGEGWTAMHHVAMTAAGSRRLLAVGDTLRNGGWHRIRVQIFPDGTCGYAVDGVPRWRSSGKIPLGQLYWIDLPGSSARTMMMVGPLQLWAGVRGDVDWSVLNR
ncbi:MAG TPA: hypothetical protein VFU23_13545, partial [Gemmatimonadales bacterium]|nr:hypothetical protein [Gemmatimonadales bacterium]